MAKDGEVEIAEARFGFGANWARYLTLVDEERIAAAEQSLKDRLDVNSLAGKRFLDIGSGSGLFSLAARNLGASVYSFDYDPEAVGCTQALRERYWPADEYWHVERGDVLDRTYLGRLEQCDVVYSWGVLHHTGDMWRALEAILPLVKVGGILFIAIYNDQGKASRRWRAIKRMYVEGSRFQRAFIIGTAIVLDQFKNMAGRIVRMQNPFRISIYKDGRDERGMSRYYDLLDWIGGYPFEVAKPEEIFDFCRNRDYELLKLKTCRGGHGCNEFIFRRRAAQG